MQTEDPSSQGDSTPARGITPVRPGQGSPHVHFWSDVTIPASAYVEEVCNGEKWSPHGGGLRLSDRVRGKASHQQGDLPAPFRREASVSLELGMGGRGARKGAMTRAAPH